jgi:hypothetical protein
VTSLKYRCTRRLVPASLVAMVLFVSLSVPGGADVSPSISLSSESIESGQSTTATAIFVTGGVDPSADPPVNAVVHANANRGLGNGGHITFAVVSTSPNLTGCVVTTIVLLQGAQVTCDWTGPPIAGDSAQIVVTITTSHDAAGGWLVNSYTELTSGKTDSFSETQFDVIRPPPITITSPPIVAPAIARAPTFAG